jgi:hypothetical protein
VNDLTLNTLAAEINMLHDAANDAAATALHYAARCGAKLNEAKAKKGHGEWLPWLEANCRVKRVQAWKYMKLAKEMPQLTSNVHYSEHLDSINTAIAYLSASDETKEKVDASPSPVTEKQIKTWEAEYREAERKAKELEKKLQERPVLEKTVTPPDYDSAKRAAVELQKELAKIEADAQSARARAESAQREMESMRRRQKGEIEAGVDAAMKMASDRLEYIKAQESAYLEKNRAAAAKLDSVLSQIAGVERRAKVQEKVRHHLVAISAELYDVVDDAYQLTSEEVTLWSSTAQQMRDGANLITKWLENHD